MRPAPSATLATLPTARLGALTFAPPAFALRPVTVGGSVAVLPGVVRESLVIERLARPGEAISGDDLAVELFERAAAGTGHVR